MACWGSCAGEAAHTRCACLPRVRDGRAGAGHTQSGALQLTGVALSTYMVPKQEEGLDTVDANRALGLPDDCREYSSVRNILADLGISSIRLMVGL